jgi:hypothetical protein
MAAPTYDVHPTNTHIYGNAQRFVSSTANPLPIRANAIYIPVGSSATVYFDDPAQGIVFTPSAVDLFLTAKISRVVLGQNEYVLFW